MRGAVLALLLFGCSDPPQGAQCLADATELLDRCLEPWCADRSGAFCDCFRQGGVLESTYSGGCECGEGDFVAEMADSACFEDLDGPLRLDCDGLRDSIVRYEERSCAP